MQSKAFLLCDGLIVIFIISVSQCDVVTFHTSKHLHIYTRPEKPESALLGVHYSKAIKAIMYRMPVIIGK